jgi:hypothetical protein
MVARSIDALLDKEGTKVKLVGSRSHLYVALSSALRSGVGAR